MNKCNLKINLKNADFVENLAKDLKYARELLKRVNDAITFENEEMAQKSKYSLPMDLAIEIATFLDN